MGTLKSSPSKIEGVPEGRGRMNKPSVTNKAGTAPRSSCLISFRQRGECQHLVSIVNKADGLTVKAVVRFICIKIDTAIIFIEVYAISFIVAHRR